mgnify:CR=1 FL=1
MFHHNLLNVVYSLLVYNPFHVLDTLLGPPSISRGTTLVIIMK